VASLLLLFPPRTAPASERGTASFLPTWKLLDSHEKEQFIAGYLQGWKDAARVTDIAISYVKTNPEKAIDGLEGIRQLYDVRGVKPSDLAHQIDEFYADPENSDAALSRAITASKKRLQ
jgi:hypothetical protein